MRNAPVDEDMYDSSQIYGHREGNLDRMVRNIGTTTLAADGRQLWIGRGGKMSFHSWILPTRGLELEWQR